MMDENVELSKKKYVSGNHIIAIIKIKLKILNKLKMIIKMFTRPTISDVLNTIC